MNKSYTEEEFDKLCDFLSFQNMRDNPGCNFERILEETYGKDFFKRVGNHFIRKGQVGDWKNHMSPELAKRFDDWIEENTKGLDSLSTRFKKSYVQNKNSLRCFVE
jgi:estrone sulfotransferase